LDIELFNYELPERLIAQEPDEKRDASRLMVLDRKEGSITHCHFSDLPEYLRAGDVLVFNDSRVIPARLIGEKRTTSAVIEIFLASPIGGYDVGSESWHALARPARRLKVGDFVDFAQDLTAEITNKRSDGSVEVVLHTGMATVLEAIELNGVVPLPPYIKHAADEVDSERYQTVYAKDPGSVAAPTAGLHFTSELIQACVDRGVQTAYVTLHVGLGTFQTVSATNITEHNMHSEWCHIDEATASLLNQAKSEQRRIICVGTTSVRTLEGFAAVYADELKGGWQSTDIFIYPGYQFHFVDAMITNFHLPKSTLLMLISAFYDREKIMEAYQEAIRSNYRFFSYGDAMLII